jgi:hypothetical protein
MPDEFDRLLGSLDGLPDTYKSKPSVLRTVPFLGVGGTRMFIVQTFRQYDKHTNKKGEDVSKARDTLFLEVTGPEGTIRLVVPNAVLDALVRQRDTLTTSARKKQAKRIAAERKKRGELPGFLMKKAG